MFHNNLIPEPAALIKHWVMTLWVNYAGFQAEESAHRGGSGVFCGPDEQWFDVCCSRGGTVPRYRVIRNGGSDDKLLVLLWLSHLTSSYHRLFVRSSVKTATLSRGVVPNAQCHSADIQYSLWFLSPIAAIPCTVYPSLTLSLSLSLSLSLTLTLTLSLSISLSYSLSLFLS